MSRMQVYDAALVALIPLILFAVVLAYVYLTRERIDASSVKYAIDHLPMGIAFYREDGLVLLVNEAMQKLSRRFMGKSLLNGKEFYAFLTVPPPDASFTVSGHAEAFLLIEGNDVWTIRQSRTETGGRRVCQLIAYDTSELYAREQELSGQVQKLHETEKALKHFEKQVETLAEGEAYLATKERIHDRLGQMLLSNRYYLTEPGAELTLQTLLDAWRSTIEELVPDTKQVADRPEQNAFIKPLAEAAAALGAVLHVTGEFPAEHVRVRRLVISAARVSINNAVRHGMADEITITFENRHADGTLMFRISNNGRVREDFTEGGGLKNLRADVEKEGGTVTYETAPRFAVIVTVPFV
ncbi:MAG: hypothetical protein IJQ26_00555, partial [Lachnospiraceae bacterium]|nr:hypothetical protein [Lachnospiraceae bacterium]